MNIEHAPVKDVLIFTPQSFPDTRGFFLESYRMDTYTSAGIPLISQWNHSRSTQGVLRGIHVQYPTYQGKLVYVVQGAIYDVAVDLRKDSPTYGQHFAIELSDTNHCQLWIPEGFGHAFYTLSPTADVLYGCTTYYQPNEQYSIRYDDPEIGIDWKNYTVTGISDKDAHAPLLKDTPFA
ncbi:MAG: dTDP-4-dehydrorhamnose 3,5-epimerase [Desulfovibrionaceae bacterium]|nr:dTDP-4-dehydrorhamnose 3,5-epimerase [Desulfovibrionaceae bacterium]